MALATRATTATAVPWCLLCKRPMHSHGKDHDTSVPRFRCFDCNATALSVRVARPAAKRVVKLSRPQRFGAPIEEITGNLIVRPWCMRCRREMNHCCNSREGIPFFECSRCPRSRVKSILRIKGERYLTRQRVQHLLLRSWSLCRVARTVKCSMRIVREQRDDLALLSSVERRIELRKFDQRPRAELMPRNTDEHPWSVADRQHYQKTMARQQKKGLPLPPGRPKGSGPLSNNRGGEVPVERLLAAFKKSGVSKCQLARRLGLMKQVPNMTAINTTLGLTRASSGQLQKTVTRHTALRYAKAMGISSFELGI